MHPELPQQLHRYAIEALKAGKLAAADLALRHVLDISPDNAPVLHLLGVIAARVGAREAAISYFRQALALEPANASIRENLRLAETLRAPVMPAGDRYLLIKSWGFGFW